MEIGKLIGRLVSVGLIPETMGTLGEVTRALLGYAAADQQKGLVLLRYFKKRLACGSLRLLRYVFLEGRSEVHFFIFLAVYYLGSTINLHTSGPPIFP